MDKTTEKGKKEERKKKGEKRVREGEIGGGRKMKRWERERKGRNKGVSEKGRARNGNNNNRSLIILLNGLNETNPETFLTSDFTDT